jgi:hypothetical protein
MNERHYTGFRVKEAIVAISCLAALCSSVTGCKDSTNAPVSTLPTATPAPTNPPPTEGFSLNSILNSIEEASNSVQEAVGPHAETAHQRTKAEVEKLHRWEYLVVDYSSLTSAQELEARLGKLGEDNWDCFSIIPSAGTSRVTCKRRPLSALSYLQLIPGF